jgi:hypothetical protein
MSKAAQMCEQVTMSKGTTKPHKILNIQKKVSGVAIKCYDEQMPDGWENVKVRIKELNPEKYIVLAIWHNRGIEERVKNDNKLCRLCVYIEGEASTGNCTSQISTSLPCSLGSASAK